MSAPTEDRPGMCAAFGCPLFGTRSSGFGNGWFCFCHIDRPATENDAITSILIQNRGLVDASLQLRQRHAGSIKRSLVEAGRRDLILGSGKPAAAWIERIEGALLDLVNESSKQAQLPAHAGVIGPEHAARSFSEAQ